MDSRYLGLDWNQWVSPTANILVPGRSGYQYSREESYKNSVKGVSKQVKRNVKVSADKYQVEESRKCTVGSSKMSTGSKTSVKQVQSKKKLAIDLPKEKKKPKVLKTIDNTSDKVKLEIFLEKSKTGVFISKVRVGKRVRWQNVKQEKQALRYHPAIRRWQTVMTAVATMKTHKTLQISMTKEESLRYKAGDLLEDIKRSKPQPKPSIEHQQIIYYQMNNNVYNPGPSALVPCIGNNDQSTSSSSFYYSSDYSTDE